MDTVSPPTPPNASVPSTASDSSTTPNPSVPGGPRSGLPVTCTTPVAAIALIGDELLSGKVVDENGSYLIHALRELGVSLKEIRVVSDGIEDIAACVRELSGRCDHLFTSGGIGPTHDDRTLEAIAVAFGVEMVNDTFIAHHVEALFTGDAEKRTTFMKMAWVPAGTVMLQTAGLRWPLYTFRNIFILPGIPEIFRRQFDAIRDRFLSTPFYLKTIYMKLGEGNLATTISQACRNFPGAAFGSYPVLHQADYRVRITIESKDKDTVDGASQWLVGQYCREDIFKVVEGS